MSLLLALTGATPPIPPIPPDPPIWVPGGTSGAFPQPSRKARKAWDWLEAEKREEAKKAEPEKTAQVERYAPDAASLAYAARIKAELIAAQTEHAKAMARIQAATVEAQRMEAQAALAVAVAREMQAQQELMDFDIAFVASVLATL